MDSKILEVKPSNRKQKNSKTVKQAWNVPSVDDNYLDDTAQIKNQAIEASPNGVVIIDVTHPDKKVIYANPAYAKVVEQSLKQSVKRPWRLIKDTKKFNQATLKNLEAAIANRTTIRLEMKWYAKDGDLRWTDLYFAPIPNSKNPSLYYIGIVTDITERKVLEQQLIHQATHDALTNLPNRVMLLEHLKQALLEAERAQNLVAVLFLDLDQFKAINDSLGHKVGDVLLKEAAKRLRNSVRKSDIVARLGGDEFIITLPFLKREADAIKIIKKILHGLRQPFTLEDTVTTVLSTPSIGVCFYPKDGDSAENLLKNADIAMYKAKEKGRNAFQIFAPEMNLQSTHRLQIERDLHTAIANEEFSLHLQPVVNLNTRQIANFEALIRWKHPKKGMIPSLEFISIAEETGLIIPIGQWVLETACEILAQWKKQTQQLVPIAINVSGIQLRQDNFFSTVKTITHNAGIEPHLLHLEVTESVLLHDAAKAIHVLSAFKNLGIKTSIDDFGAGYSSLSYLKLFPVSKLKIDRSFIMDLVTNESNMAITQAIISIAHHLKMSVVAEGVEKAGQVALLQQMRCNEAQGYYFSPPVSAEQAWYYLSQQSVGNLLKQT